jgi:catechol 2,3-dioxygenase-like lactoylglutathione lyase family enzyme
MKISITSVLVNDQEKAIKFYTNILGFEIKTEIPVGEYKWITVVSKEQEDGVELLLEPISFDPAETYQQALYEAGIPCTTFQVKSLDYEYERLKELNVEFKMIPTSMGNIKMAILDDTCGNWIQLVEII